MNNKAKKHSISLKGWSVIGQFNLVAVLLLALYATIFFQLSPSGEVIGKKLMTTLQTELCSTDCDDTQRNAIETYQTYITQLPLPDDAPDSIDSYRQQLLDIMIRAEAVIMNNAVSSAGETVNVPLWDDTVREATRTEASFSEKIAMVILMSIYLFLAEAVLLLGYMVLGATMLELLLLPLALLFS